jgi:hypothetical protein
MWSQAQALGASSALAAFGVKIAGQWDTYLDEVKRQGVGHPQEAWKQFRKGQLFHPTKGLSVKSLPKSPGELAAALAWPVMGSFLTARANPEIGGGELAGDFLGRATGSLLGAPLGAAGQLGSGMLLAPVGQAVGKMFDSPRGTDVVSDD